MPKKDLKTEIVKALEAGFNTHLNRSIFYSPFRLFFNLYKKNNPKTINYAREIIGSDIIKIISAINNFDEKIFIIKKSPTLDQLTEEGKELLKKCYNIGIRLLKKDLTVRIAFRAIRDENLRQEIYEHILKEVEKVAHIILLKKFPNNQNKILS